jgi:hypothetical protein
MLLTAGVHLAMNWSVYFGYLWQRAANRLNQKWELALALTITVAIACAASLGDHGNAQRFAAMSLQNIAASAGKSTEDMVALLKTEGIAVHDPADSLLEIAGHNQLPPDRVLAAIQRHAPEIMKAGGERHP